jgi:hypothetical protein
MLGLCLVAIFAISAVAAAGAYASGRPEYKACGKTPKVGKTYPTGEFSNKECTDPASGGKYRLEEVAEGTSFTSKSKATVITADGKTVKCKKDTGAGAILSQFEGTDKITFADCAVNGNKKEPCGTSGSIETNQLATGLFFVNEDETENGVALIGEEGVFADFKCGAQTVVVEGIVLGLIANTSKGEKITFAVSGGHQALQDAWFSESSIPAHLESDGEEATLETTEEQGPKGVGVFD